METVIYLLIDIQIQVQVTEIKKLRISIGINHK